MSFLLRLPIFRGYVKFPGCKSHETLLRFIVSMRGLASIQETSTRTYELIVFQIFLPSKQLTSSFNWSEAGFQSLVIWSFVLHPSPTRKPAMLTTRMASLVGHVVKQHWETRLIKEQWTNNTVVKQRWETSKTRESIILQLGGRSHEGEAMALIFCISLYICVYIYIYTGMCTYLRFFYHTVFIHIDPPFFTWLWI